MVEKTGQMLDGTAFQEKIVSRYKSQNIELHIVENKNNEKSIVFTISEFPMMKLRGSYPAENGVFMFKSLEYLAGNTHGWNEYSLDLIGEGTLSFGTDVLLELCEFETVQISQGKIHRYDTRITGDEALTALRNRRERIIATVEWMKKTENAPKAQDLTQFEKYWKPVFFPEVVSRKNKPKDWKKAGDTFIRAEDIRWNTNYTSRVFSEDLWQVRNTGTLLRDWEESLSWLYLEYEWDNIIKLFSNEINFNKIK